MLELLPLLFFVQNVGSQPDLNVKFRDRSFGPTAVTDKDMRPMKAPDCKTEAAVQRTLVQLSHGEPGECFIRDRRAFSRSRG